MYKCPECNAIFEEPILIRTTYESYYGVSDLQSNTPLTLELCPNCKAENIEEIEEEIEEDE